MVRVEQHLRLILEQRVRSISIGHVNNDKDVLQLRDEIAIKVDVDFQDVQNGHPMEAGA